MHSVVYRNDYDTETTRIYPPDLYDQVNRLIEYVELYIICNKQVVLKFVMTFLRLLDLFLRMYPLRKNLPPFMTGNNWEMPMYPC